VYRCEILAALKREGLDASVERLRGARKAQIFRPRPIKNVVGFFEYRSCHLGQFRTYLNTIRTGCQPSHVNGPVKKRRERAERLAKNDAAIQQLESIAKRTKT